MHSSTSSLFAARFRVGFAPCREEQGCKEDRRSSTCTVARLEELESFFEGARDWQPLTICLDLKKIPERRNTTQTSQRRKIQRKGRTGGSIDLFSNSLKILPVTRVNFLWGKVDISLSSLLSLFHPSILSFSQSLFSFPFFLFFYPFPSPPHFLPQARSLSLSEVTQREKIPASPSAVLRFSHQPTSQDFNSPLSFLLFLLQISKYSTLENQLNQWPTMLRATALESI